jgi:hypothetical protein
MASSLCGYFQSVEEKGSRIQGVKDPRVKDLDLSRYTQAVKPFLLEQITLTVTL